MTSPSQIIEAASKTAAVKRSVHVQFATNSIPDLLVNSYSAEVTTDPAPAVRGSGQLKVNKRYTPTDFFTNDGKLWIKGTDDRYTEVGTAAGRFDPAVLLDPRNGLAAVLAAVQNPKDAGQSDIDGSPASRVSGTIDPKSASVFVPASAFGQAREIPVELWISPGQPHTLIQLVATVGSGSFTIKLGKASPFTTAPK